MEFGGTTFILAIIMMSFIAWVINTAIRAKYGYPVENEWGGTSEKLDATLRRQNEILEGENEALRGKLARLEERTAVLERITTDPANRLASQIEELRT